MRVEDMSNIYDLTHIQKLIEAERIPAVLIIDTGVILDEPDLARWSSSLKNPVFVLTCRIPRELEHLKNVPQRNISACAADENLISLCRDGRIIDGIMKDRIGWFIGVTPPEKGKIEEELKRLDLIVKAFGLLNTRLIILAREIQSTLPDIPIFVLTKNPGLYNALKFMGINSMLFDGFPLSDLEERISGSRKGMLDWDAILQGIEIEAENRLVQVEISLSSRSIAPGWVNGSDEFKGKSPLLLAQGSGVVHAAKDLRFNWTLPYIAWDFPEVNATIKGAAVTVQYGSEKLGGMQPGKVYLDFSGPGPGLSAELQKVLTDTIGSFASPMSYIEDLPTVQDPLAVIKQFLVFEFALSERRYNGDLNAESLQEFEGKLKNTENLLNWAYYWLRDRNGDPEEVDVSLSEFLHAVKSCWNIGETFKFTLLDNPAEIGNIKEKAEG
jgi:hypothetical protein